MSQLFLTGMEPQVAIKAIDSMSLLQCIMPYNLCYVRTSRDEQGNEIKGDYWSCIYYIKGQRYERHGQNLRLLLEDCYIHIMTEKE